MSSLRELDSKILLKNHPITRELAGTSQETLARYAVDAVSFFWETNCDKSLIQLELLMYNSTYGYSKLWSYSQSPYNSGYNNVLVFPQKIPVGYVPVFRVSVVPEPSSVLVLLLFGSYFGGSGAFVGLFS